MIYLTCFDEPYQHANHYLGYCDETRYTLLETITNRVNRHASGRGSRLLQVVTQAGIGWRVVRVWPGARRDDERRLKAHSSTRYCPRCSGEAAYRRGIIVPTTVDGAVFMREVPDLGFIPEGGGQIHLRDPRPDMAGERRLLA